MKKLLVLAFITFIACCTFATASVVSNFVVPSLVITKQNSSGDGLTLSNGSISAPSSGLYATYPGTNSFNGLDLGNNALLFLAVNSATVTGLGTFVGVSATAPIEASSNGSTPSYLLPMYAAATASTSTAHIVEGDYVPGVTGTVTITLSGASIFSNTTYFAYCRDITSNYPAVGIIVNASSFTCSIPGAATDIVHYYAVGT